MNKVFFVFTLALCCAVVRPVCAADHADTLIPLNNHRQLRMSEPVVIALAPIGETRWGQYQFPSLSAYPGGKLMVRFHAGADSVLAYGSREPTFLSSDQGATWSACQVSGLPDAGLVSELFDDQFLCMAMPKPLDLRALNIELPKSVGEFFCYRTMKLYRAEECPAPVQEFLRHQSCSRWSERERHWLPATIDWDMRGRLVWIAQGTEAGLVTGTGFERSPIRVGTELLWADYRASYARPDGSAPKGCGSSCMVSTNNGLSWQRRAPIADADAIAGEISNMTEPVLSQTVGGSLACVVRRTDQKQKSMLITFSRNQGRTWETPRALDELGHFGVMPDLLLLKSGPLVLSYGRPGVNLTFSLDGSGKSWMAPISLLPGNAHDLTGKTDGYTALHALGPSEFLICYTDFEHRDEQGRKRKAVLVRRCSLE